MLASQPVGLSGGGGLSQPGLSESEMLRAVSGRSIEEVVVSRKKPFSSLFCSVFHRSA